MKIKKILFHTQFRQFAFNSLKTILELKKAGLTEVVLTFVIPREEVSFVPYGGYLKNVERYMREKAKLRFQDWQKTISKMGVGSKIRIKTGIVNAAVLSIAKEEGVDLIVIGAKKRTTFEKVYVGSHILDVLRRSEVPVLMHKYRVQFESNGGVVTQTNDRIFERPLLATDWSTPSENAMETILGLKEIAKKGFVVHVIGSKLIKGADQREIDRIKNESEIRLNAYCLRLKDAGIDAEPHLSIGNFVPEILRLSRETESTMIVMGKTGKDWMHQYWLGGVSHRIAEFSELPVLLVP
ncbi:MAG: universal stress protein [Pseudomonadota bacterium]